MSLTVNISIIFFIASFHSVGEFLEFLFTKNLSESEPLQNLFPNHSKLIRKTL